ARSGQDQRGGDPAEAHGPRSGPARHLRRDHPRGSRWRSPQRRADGGQAARGAQAPPPRALSAVVRRADRAPLPEVPQARGLRRAAGLRRPVVYELLLTAALIGAGYWGVFFVFRRPHGSATFGLMLLSAAALSGLGLVGRSVDAPWLGAAGAIGV